MRSGQTDALEAEITRLDDLGLDELRNSVARAYDLRHRLERGGETAFMILHARTEQRGAFGFL
jgi:hypothetical protein